MTVQQSSEPSLRKAILAASSPGLAAALNLLPGLGTGYIYQRRWRAYWLTAGLASLGIGANAFKTLPAAGEWGAVKVSPGFVALMTLATLTAAEAFLAARRARMN